MLSDYTEEQKLQAVKSFFKFIKVSIENLPLKEDLTEEQFNKLKTNFNIPKLGKLHCTWEEYKKTKLGVERKKKYAKKIKHKSSTSP